MRKIFFFFLFLIQFINAQYIVVTDEYGDYALFEVLGTGSCDSIYSCQLRTDDLCINNSYGYFWKRIEIKWKNNAISKSCLDKYFSPVPDTSYSACNRYLYLANDINLIHYCMGSQAECPDNYIKVDGYCRAENYVCPDNGIPKKEGNTYTCDRTCEEIGLITDENTKECVKKKLVLLLQN